MCCIKLTMRALAAARALVVRVRIREWALEQQAQQQHSEHQQSPAGAGDEMRAVVRWSGGALEWWRL